MKVRHWPSEHGGQVHSVSRTRIIGIRRKKTSYPQCFSKMRGRNDDAGVHLEIDYYFGNIRRGRFRLSARRKLLKEGKERSRRKQLFGESY